MSNAKSSSEWISEIETSIVSLKSRNKKYYFLFNETMTKETAHAIDLHFRSQNIYEVETKKCASCANKYDIIISWTNPS